MTTPKNHKKKMYQTLQQNIILNLQCQSISPILQLIKTKKMKRNKNSTLKEHLNHSLKISRQFLQLIKLLMIKTGI